MDYERIGETQGGRFSPAKLRALLLGVEKMRREEQIADSASSLRSEASEACCRGFSTSESCKDLGVVSILPDCPSSMASTMDSLANEIASNRRLKERALANSKTRFQDGWCAEYDDGRDNSSMSSVGFEFQKAERALHRVPFSSASKPAPSKWDDAEKWIASPVSNRPKAGQSHPQPCQMLAPRKTGLAGCGNRTFATKTGFEVTESTGEIDTERIDSSQGKAEIVGSTTVNWEAKLHPTVEVYMKPALMVESSFADSAVSLSRHDSSIATCSTTAFIPPPSTVRSVSMRDMGTDMTPIDSQEPSRNGTPSRETPIPSSSRLSTPAGVTASVSTAAASNCQAGSDKKELSEKELQMKTRHEIKALGTQLGKMNIAAWASEVEEKNDLSASLRTAVTDQPSKSAIGSCAEAWEEAEKAKYMARYKREEIKIQAWENHQKAKTEAEMRKIEVEVEKMRANAHEKLMNKLASARHKAEEKRAAAENKRNKQAARTEQQAKYIRRTGHIPPAHFSCWEWCS